jgi:heptosyltransferase-2
MGTENLPQRLSAVKRLVILAPNWLGDAVMALPAVEDVRRVAPRATIVMAARASIAPLFRLVASVDDAIVLGGRDDHERLRSGGFEIAMLLPNSFQSALTVWRAGIAGRWGYRTDLRGPLLTRAVAPPAQNHHQGAYYQHLTRALGIPSGPLTPRLAVSDDERRVGRAMLADAGWDGQAPLVAMAPGAAYGGAKRWPAASFAALARDLESDGFVPVLIGGAADRPAGLAVAGAIGHRSRVITLIGRTDLPALGGALAHCRALVSNDSGAMHFAAALGVPVTALFGPTDERATHPLGPAPHVVLTNPVWCRPCLLRECPLDHRCMREITVEAAASATRRWL